MSSNDTTTDTDPEPIDCNARAQLDYATDPDRPLSIHVEIPPGVVGSRLEDVTDAVQVSASVVDE